MMFFAGVIAVSVFNKKGEIITYTKNIIAKIDMRAIVTENGNTANKLGVLVIVALKKYIGITWKKLKWCIFKILTCCSAATIVKDNRNFSNFVLLKKIKEIIEERKRLGLLLMAAVHENNNLKIQYQMETMAKNRFLRYIQDTQKKVKENRSKYVNFQHLYLMTHQENIFLKTRLRRLTKDKENVEKDLVDIIKQVYNSKNNDLMAYCSRFLVRPRASFINADIKEEVRKFLQKNRMPLTLDRSDGDKDVRIWPTSPIIKETESCRSNTILLPIISEAPKLKGLPGECIWTVKDKDGIIEKLYEYDFDSDLDNGDTIRRIRQYSVYHDKDCLLDFSSSRTIVTEDYNTVRFRCLNSSKERFLTGSEAFQRFLLNNKNVIPTSTPSTPTRSLLCV
ncbi:unnamed protein product [Diatraea saccharalis]|nr:unnamed protein product [Diatraea saccharalis]